jgi:hypothetical protein
MEPETLHQAFYIFQEPVGMAVHALEILEYTERKVLGVTMADHGRRLKLSWARQAEPGGQIPNNARGNLDVYRLSLQIE